MGLSLNFVFGGWGCLFKFGFCLGVGLVYFDFLGDYFFLREFFLLFFFSVVVELY